jgi:hypothetical protein
LGTAAFGCSAAHSSAGFEPSANQLAAFQLAEKLVVICGQHPSAAKAGLIFVELSGAA